MALRVDDVSTICASKDTWTIVVKVIRLWLTPSYSGSKLPPSLEMVLMDSKGSKIHATIRRTLVYRFQNQISEGRVYQISFFGVCENGGDFRTTCHPYKINFQMHSTVRVMANTSISANSFSFLALSDVVFKEPDTSFLIDVIGILTGSSGEQEFEKHGKVQKRITLEIDQDGVRVEAAFFGKYVDEIVGQLASGDMTNAVVVVQFAKIKPFKGKPSIQNVYGATKILFNHAIDEVGPIREKFFETHGPSAQVLTQLHDSGKLSPAEDFLKQNEGKTIEQIKDLAEKSVCVVLASVKFIPHDNSWYYPACKCNKKVYPAEDMYFCEACVRHVVTAIPKYKIRLRVMDSKDSTTFVLFDQEAHNLLNKPCAELVEKCHKDPNDSQLPSEILDLIDKTFLFKVDVDNSSNTWFEQSYKVKRICSDPDVISQFKIANPQLEGSPPYMLLTTPSSGGLIEGSSSSFAKDLNEEFNVAGVPVGLTSPSSSAVDLSKDSQEGSIVLAPVRELRMQYPSIPKICKGKSEILFKGKEVSSAIVSAGSNLPASPNKEKISVGEVVTSVVDVGGLSSGQVNGTSIPKKDVIVPNKKKSVAKKNISSAKNGSSASESNEQKPDKDVGLDDNIDAEVAGSGNSQVPLDVVKNELQKPDKDDGFDCNIDAEIAGNGNSQVPLDVVTNESPPLKRPTPVDAEAVGNSVGNKKPLKMVKKEKV